MFEEFYNKLNQRKKDGLNLEKSFQWGFLEGRKAATNDRLQILKLRNLIEDAINSKMEKEKFKLELKKILTLSEKIK